MYNEEYVKEAIKSNQVLLFWGVYMMLFVYMYIMSSIGQR